MEVQVGSLDGMTVIEMAGLGPAPFAGMMLGDQGARVIRVDRPGGADGTRNVLCRNRTTVALDLKTPEGREVVLKLLERADALIEGFRPGVMERLGLGPTACLERRPQLVYGRMTGWGQEGPLAAAAGHDINYISLAGVAHAIGHADGAPVPPLNLVGDYGGGGMFLAFGVMCGLWEARRSGLGQVIDAAMVDGASALMAEYYGFMGNGQFTDRRGTHLLDGGAPFYGLYETADGQHISIGPLEARFYRELLQRLALDGPEWQVQDEPGLWPAMKQRLREIFMTRTREQWTRLLEGTDVCFAPVLSLAEVAGHPHNRERKTIVAIDGMLQPAPAPRFGRTPASLPRAGTTAGAQTQQVLREVGYSDADIARMIGAGVAHQD